MPASRSDEFAENCQSSGLKNLLLAGALGAAALLGFRDEINIKTCEKPVLTVRTKPYAGSDQPMIIEETAYSGLLGTTRKTEVSIPSGVSR